MKSNGSKQKLGLDRQGRQNLNSEYASMGRLGSALDFHKDQQKGNQNYQSPQISVKLTKQPQALQMQQTSPKLDTIPSENRPTLLSKNSLDNSENCNQVADEDGNSYKQFMNDYLEDGIQVQNGLQFKQEPKHGKNTRPNPNFYSSTALIQKTTTSPLKIQQKQTSSNRRIFDTNQAQQNNKIVSNQVQVRGPSPSTHHVKTSSGPQISTPQINSNVNKNGARRIVPKTKSDGIPNEVMTRASTQLLVLPLNQKLTQQQKSEEMTGSARKNHPMFLQRMIPDEQQSAKKQAMIHQFEMNLMSAKGSGTAQQVYSQRELVGKSGSMQGIMNKATLCDSAASKIQNTTGSNSQFLRKSLWLLTNSKSKALKEIVQQNKVDCALCHYIHAYSHLTIAANINGSANKALNPNQSSIFMFNHHCNATKTNHDNYFSLQGTESHGLHRQVLNSQISTQDSKTKINHNSKLLSVEATRQTSKSKSLHQQSLPEQTNLGSVQSNLRINLKIQSPRSPQSPGTPTSPEQQAEIYVNNRRQVRRANNYQQKQGSSLLSTSNASVVGAITQNGNIQVSSQSAGQYGQIMNSIILHQELHSRFEAQYFNFLLKRSLVAKYMTSQEYYNSKVAADIMYNEQRHIVSVFKEYLIFDDFSEYLKRFYLTVESVDRLPRIFEFYEHYSKVFPNYVALPESKYMFKNIERKQKLIDQRHKIYLKHQKVQAGDISQGGETGSMLVLFNSQFLKEVYNEPPLISYVDPRDQHEIQINQFSKVQNNPPNQKLLKCQSNSNLNASRNQREFENIIGLLNRFDKIVDESIIARELLSDSLFKEPVSVKERVGNQALMQGLIQKKEVNRINVGVNDFTMSSWQSVDSKMFIHQDSGYEMASEILGQACEIYSQKTPKQAVSSLTKFVFTQTNLLQNLDEKITTNIGRDFGQSKKSLNGPPNEFKIELGDLKHNGTEESVANKKKFNQEDPSKGLSSVLTQKVQKQSTKGIHSKLISIGTDVQQEKSASLQAHISVTRNQDFGQGRNAATYQQQKTVSSNISSVAAPVLRPELSSSVKQKSLLANQDNQRSKARLIDRDLYKGTQSQTNFHQRSESQSILIQKSQGPTTFKQNIQNLILRESTKAQQLTQSQFNVIQSKVKLTESKVKAASRNDMIKESDGSSMPFLPARTLIDKDQKKSLKEVTEYDMKDIQKFQKNGSRTSLAGASTHQPQQTAKLMQSDQTEDQLSHSRTKVSKNGYLQEAIARPDFVQNLPSNTKFKITSKVGEADSRKIKTSINMREPLQNTTDAAKLKPNMFQKERPTTDLRNYETQKTSTQSLMNTQPIQPKNMIVGIKAKKLSKPQHDLQENLGSNRQITPYQLLSYFSSNKQCLPNVESQKELPQTAHIVSPDHKQRTSKSESIQKTIKESNYGQLNDQNMPIKMHNKITNGHITDQVTMAAVNYFLQTHQSNPYDKTGRVQSVYSNSSGKQSAGSTHNMINASKGRNKMPNSKNLIAVKLNAASIAKPIGTASSISLGQSQKFYLPNQGGSGNSLKSGMSNLSQKQVLANAKQMYSLKTSDQNLYALAQKSSVLMKKSTPSSQSSSKAKKKTIPIVASKNMPVKSNLLRNAMAGTQGHTIFAVNPSRPIN